MKKVLVLGEIPAVGYDVLREHNLEIDLVKQMLPEKELCRRIRDKDALLCPLSAQITKEVIDAGAHLKIIANFGAGYDNIALEHAKEKGIVVTNTPGVSTEATAELTFGLLLSVSRRIVEGDRLCRTKGFNGWAPLFFLGRELYQKTLGIIGLGKIGQAVAKRAKAFGMKIIYTSRHRKDARLETELGVTFKPLDQLLREADFVTIHTPYNAGTHHLLDKDKFAIMKKDAYLINASRGPIVHEADLIDALKRGNIAGAALDVFEFEPEISAALKTLDNVVLTPHIGNATIETRNEMAKLAARNIVHVLKNDMALTPV